MMRRKFTRVLKSKGAIVGAIACMAITTVIVGTSMFSTNNTKDNNTNLVDLNELPDSAKAEPQSLEESTIDTVAGDNIQANNYSPDEFGMDNVMDATDEYKEEESTQLHKEAVIDTNEAEVNEAEVKEDTSTDESEEKQTTVSKATVKAPNFLEESKMAWPVSGNVLINYSMDSTVYFATLNQYKYNSALIIQGEVNTKVNAAADGVVMEVFTDEETGITMNVDLGNGYTAIYGQLKETTVKKGDAISKGATMGYISEPTKYYSVEGSNLYFKVMKDDAPVNPMNFLE